MNESNSAGMIGLVFKLILGVFKNIGKLIKSSFIFMYVFRITTVWLLIAAVVVNINKDFGMFLVWSALAIVFVSLVDLPNFVNSVGNKFGKKSEKVKNVFDKTYSFLNSFYYKVQSVVRKFSIGADFKRFKNINIKNTALVNADRFLRKDTGIIAMYDRRIGDAVSNEKLFGVYKVREHNGEIVSSKNDLGNTVFYIPSINGRYYSVLNAVDDVNEFIQNIKDSLGAYDFTVSPEKNIYFYGTPIEYRIEFIEKVDQELIDGNNFLKSEGVVDEKDTNFYNVSVETVNGVLTVHINDKVGNSTNDLINKLNSVSTNNSIEYMDIVRNGSNVKAVYYLDPDEDLKLGNDLLRNSGIITDNSDKSLYNVSFVHSSNGNSTVVIRDQIGFKTREDIQGSLTKIKSNFGAKYVDLKQIHSANDPWLTFEYVRNIDKSIEEAHSLLKEARILDKNDSEIYEIDLDRQEDQVVLNINEFIYGVKVKDIISSVEGLKDRFGARLVRSRKVDNKIEVIFVIKDFLASTKQITGIPLVEEKDMRVQCAVDAFGNYVSLSIKNISGAGIMGMPGSGKSGSPKQFFASYAANPNTDFNFIDCKGGADWDGLIPLSNRVIKGATTEEELTEIDEYLKEVNLMMNERIATMKQKTGKANFWDASPEERRKGGVKGMVVMIDEAQDLFYRGNGARDPLSALSKSIEDSIISIVSKGRSSGITLFWITQRPTNDAIPSAITKKSALKIAFKTSDSYIVNSFFGKDIPFGEPNPIDIPQGQPGRAVLYNDEVSKFEEVRFFFIDDRDFDKASEQESRSYGSTAGDGVPKDNKKKPNSKSYSNNKTSNNTSNNSNNKTSNDHQDEDYITAVKTIKQMLLKAEDMRGYDSEREIARKAAEKLMRKFNINYSDLN